MLRHVSPPKNPRHAALWTEAQYEHVLHALRGQRHSVGLEMKRPTRRAIHSATACDVRDKQALHLVMSGAQGPVNVYVMPDEPMERVITGQGEGWHGLVVPVRHGSMAVVGHPKEDLQTFVRDVRGSLRWRL